MPSEQKATLSGRRHSRGSAGVTRRHCISGGFQSPPFARASSWGFSQLPQRPSVSGCLSACHGHGRVWLPSGPSHFFAKFGHQRRAYNTGYAWTVVWKCTAGAARAVYAAHATEPTAAVPIHATAPTTAFPTPPARGSADPAPTGRAGAGTSAATTTAAWSYASTRLPYASSKISRVARFWIRAPFHAVRKPSKFAAPFRQQFRRRKELTEFRRGTYGHGR